MTRLVRLDWLDPGSSTHCARISMVAPRANALEPALLCDLHAALDDVEQKGATAVLICGGKSFSSGGDVRRFLEEVSAGNGAAYAREVVGGLQSLVLRLIEMPRLVGVAARGAVTGGAAGLLFAADAVAVAPDTFVQPYYAQVGFAPDGGWTALLPERIGAGRALDWLLSDRRLGADAVVELGLARNISTDPEDAVLKAITGQVTGAEMAAKRLVWDASRRESIARRLSAETSAFIDRLGTPEVVAGMTDFLEKRSRAHV